jgi:hypothetical protein
MKHIKLFENWIGEDLEPTIEDLQRLALIL